MADAAGGSAVSGGRESAVGEAEEVYHVEEILDKRMRGGMIQYLVKWQDYAHTDNTWEPLENLTCIEIVADFERKWEEKRRHEERLSSGGKQHTIQPGPASQTNRSPYARRPSSSSAAPETPPAASQFVMGFRRGLEPERIISAIRVRGQLMMLMKWKGSEDADMVPAHEANVKCPQVVIRFYEKHVTWD